MNPELFKLKTFFIALVPALLVLCSNPSDVEPFKWPWAADVPVTNQRFYIADELDGLIDTRDSEDTVDSQGMQIIADIDTGVDGDTAIFSQGVKDSIEFSQTQDEFNSTTFLDSIGQITIANAPDFTSVPMPLGIALDTNLTQIGGIRFDESSNALLVTVTNNTSVTLSNVIVTIDGLNSSSIASISSGAQSTASITLAGHRITSPISIAVNADNAGSVPGGETVALDFSFNGTIADSLSVLDSLISISKTFSKKFEISDSLELYYTDVSEGRFIYTVKNGTDPVNGLNIRTDIIHHHIWTRSQCELRSAEKFTQLPTLFDTANNGPDMQYYTGQITGSNGFTVNAGTNSEVSGGFNLGGYRLFAEWDSINRVSISPIDLIISTTPPTGRMVTLEESDTISITIDPVTFGFSKAKGILREPFSTSVDTQMVEIPWPENWSESSRDSLRGKFNLEKVEASFNITPQVKDSAYIDTFKLFVHVFDPQTTDSQGNSTLTIDTTYTFTNIRNNTVIPTSLRVESIINAFHDSIGVSISSTVPVNTEILVIDDGRLYSNAIGGMTIKADIHYDMKVFLSWQTTSPVSLDLGSAKFKMLPALALFRKMQEKEAAVIFDVYNNTNVNIKLFALYGPDTLSRHIDTLDSDSAFGLTQSTDQISPDGYINLLGNAGVTIPARNSNQLDTVALNDEQMSRMFETETDSGSWRWFIQFQQQDSADAMHDTDYIDINSNLYLYGIHSTDSLMATDSAGEINW